SDDLGDLQRQAADYTPNKDKAAIGENILGLRLLCLYGLKGAAEQISRTLFAGDEDSDFASYHSAAMLTLSERKVLRLLAKG
ncbi:hypothetical protein F6S25_32360, partial [Klebsiella pneumoniae]|nr:hypothetical protein [Klebsiella pneumoniae]